MVEKFQVHSPSEWSRKAPARSGREVAQGTAPPGGGAEPKPLLQTHFPFLESLLTVPFLWHPMLNRQQILAALPSEAVGSLPPPLHASCSPEGQRPSTSCHEPAKCFVTRSSCFALCCPPPLSVLHTVARWMIPVRSSGHGAPIPSDGFHGT